MNKILLENRLFFTPIFSTEIETDFEKLISLAMSLEYFEREKSSGIQTKNYFLFEHSEMIPLFKIIQPYIDEISFRLGIDAKLKLLNYWFNIHRKNDYSNSHYHREGLVSGVLYIKSPLDSGKIVFERTDLQEHYFEADNLTEYSYKNYSYEPKIGRLILFPSYIKHRVDPNKTLDLDDKRISISFNYGKN